jgi:uncharacterized membrane protein
MTPTSSAFEADTEPSLDAEAGETRSDAGNRSRLALAAFMAGAGIVHFVIPRFYEQIVPKWLGHERELVLGSGVVEILSGALIAIPRTKRLGAWLAFVTILAVYPANIQMAIDAGRPHDAFSWGPWLRLPLQFPMLAWAYRRATR